MLLAASIVCWSVIAYVGFRSHATTLPAVHGLEMHRQVRPGPVTVMASSTPSVPRLTTTPVSALPEAAATPVVAVSKPHAVSTSSRLALSPHH